MLYILNDNKFLYQLTHALNEALTTLNILSELVYTIKETDDIYILYTVNTIDKEDLPNRYIVYNFEQLTTTRIWPDSFYEKLEQAEQVWDYSLENIKHLKNKNIIAHHLPFGYSPCLENNIDTSEVQKTYDILFLASLNNRRIQFLKDLKQKLPDKEYYVHDKCFHKDYDIAVASSKITLNVHFYPSGNILEVSRIIPLIANKCLVITEKSYDKWYDDKLKNIVKFCDLDQFDKVIKICLDNYDFITNTFIPNAYNKLKTEMNYVDIIRNSGITFSVF